MRLLKTPKLTGAQAESLLLFFLLFVSFGLCLVVILIHSLTVFSFIPNPTTVSSSCIAIANFLAYLVVAIKFPSTSDGEEQAAHAQKSSMYRQYWIFVLHGITALVNAGFCAAQFVVSRPEQVELFVNVVGLACIVQGWLVETFWRSVPVFLNTPLARLALRVGVTLLPIGVVCLFFPDLLIQHEILWLLPCLMHFAQLLVYTAIYVPLAKMNKALPTGKVVRMNIFSTPLPPYLLPSSEPLELCIAGGS
ncbi:hypothetical protein FRB90_008937, partial [Tulasnella sp. 427]